MAFNRPPPTAMQEPRARWSQLATPPTTTSGRRPAPDIDRDGSTRSRIPGRLINREAGRKPRAEPAGLGGQQLIKSASPPPRRAGHTSQLALNATEVMRNTHSAYRYAETLQALSATDDLDRLPRHMLEAGCRASKPVKDAPRHHWCSSCWRRRSCLARRPWPSPAIGGCGYERAARRRLLVKPGICGRSGTQ